MFEGKEIWYTNDTSIHRALVVACVKDIGITVVDKANPDQYLACIRMKKSPNFGEVERGDIGKSEKLFTLIRRAIIAGTIDMRIGSSLRDGIEKIYGKDAHGTAPSAETCPFN